MMYILYYRCHCETCIWIDTQRFYPNKQILKFLRMVLCDGREPVGEEAYGVGVPAVDRGL